MSYTSYIQSNKSIKKNDINIFLLDTTQLYNVNTISKKINIHKIHSVDTIKYTDIFAHKFIKVYITRTPEVNSINMNLLFDNINDILNYRGGYNVLMSMEINEIIYNSNMISNNISLQSIFMIYKYIYNLKLDNIVSYNRNIGHEIKSIGPEVKNITDFDNILVNYLNTPNSKFELMNSIFFYRSFPIFNYIMYTNRKRYCDTTNDNFDLIFNNPTKLNTTCLDYLLTNNTEIEEYINNIRNLLNININVLDYSIYVMDEIIKNPIITYIYNKIQNSINDLNNYILFDNDIVENINNFNENELSNNLHSIVVEEIRLDYGKQYTDMYFNINKLLKLPNVTINDYNVDEYDYTNLSMDTKILTYIRKNNIQITTKDIHRLIVRGLLRFYIEALTSIIISCVNIEKSDLIEITKKDISNSIIYTSLRSSDDIYMINNIKMEVINKCYDYTLGKEKYKFLYSRLAFKPYILKKLVSKITEPAELDEEVEGPEANLEFFPDNYDYTTPIDDNVLNISFSVCKYKKLYRLLCETNFSTQISIIEKFNNTISIINTIKNSKNYPLHIFLLFSNIDVKVLLDPSFNNNSLCRSLDNLYNPKYIAYIRNM
ncbi:unknown similar to AMEV044 [Choristoneura biennis entomopoxvirus]|uniref:Uncharacterized protein n=1 Tax=Choristoneura biennis entomopoxvirus TaxID=10288 RepID=A0A916NXM4_CBEPV|nr:unknown similar to AMEV044 [Choristoneura biennis entomopoxvirus]CCU55647.1 unknown similar to AMEV044 [Choristoneura biennis entomopoxvirus]